MYTARKKITQWKNTYWQVLPHLEEYERTSAQFDHSVHSDDNTSDDIDHEASRPKKIRECREMEDLVKGLVILKEIKH